VTAETAVEVTAAAEAPRRRSWRLPAAWRERTDWVSTDTTLGQVLRGLRWGALGVYVFVLGYQWNRYGVPFDRTGLLFWIAVGLGCFCIGRHPVWLLWVLIDFLPLAAVLIAYDRLRGWSYTAGLPTWWHPQIDVDKALFNGSIPTVWLQEHLKHATVQWYDVAVCICYFSFFFLPYLLAGVMWLRSRTDFYRWTGRFVGLSFLGFTLFVLFPAAPPWAAARCTAAEVAKHPSNPSCMTYSPALSHNGLLGHYGAHLPGTHAWVDAGIATRGFSRLHLSVAGSMVDQGRAWADPVAAVPSLHVGGTVLFVLFMWSRVNKWWRVLLAAYPVLMMFSLAYGAEHYVSDGIAGALCAWLVHWTATRIERRRRRSRAPDTLGSPPVPIQETSCPPTPPPPVTTPSSI
jgi:PAP2 superfamily